MANSSSGPGDIFDMRKIRRLVELMNEHDLNEIDLKQADQRIRLRRGSDPILTTAPPIPPSPPPIASTANQPSAPPPPEDEANVTYITSPMVGTFYPAANPESASFVKIGDAVGPETTVCIIEAMKVFNEIPAECSGKVIEVLVENGDPVEFGQKLFKLSTSS